MDEWTSGLEEYFVGWLVGQLSMWIHYGDDNDVFYRFA